MASGATGAKAHALGIIETLLFYRYQGVGEKFQQVERIKVSSLYRTGDLTFPDLWQGLSLCQLPDDSS